MFKFMPMGKETIAILGAQTILIWTYAPGRPFIKKLQHFTQNYLFSN